MQPGLGSARGHTVRDPSRAACVITGIGGSIIVLFTVGYALIRPVWWLVVPVAAMTAVFFVLAQHEFHVVDELNDLDNLDSLSEADRREVRISNCERGIERNRLRLRCAGCSTAVMYVIALAATFHVVGQQRNVLPWLALVVFIGFSATIEYALWASQAQR